MRKLFYTIIIATSSIFVSCSDFLDQTPSTSLPTDESITSLKDLQLAVNGVYYVQTGYTNANIPYGTPQGVYAGDYTVYADLKGGDFRAIGNNNQIAAVGKYTVDPANSVTLYFYAKFYKSIALVNSTLAQLENVPVNNENAKEVAEFNDLKGQLYALRGMLHFDLARLYGRLPSTVTDLNAPSSGIVIADKVFPKDYNSTRATLKETYDFVLADFETALPLLSKSKHDGYINYWATRGLQARAYLYLENNQKALEISEDIIANSPYKLYTITDYSTVWSKAYTDESMFEITINETYNAQRNSLGYYTHAEAYAECGLTDAFADFLKSKPNDVRSSLVATETYKTITGVFPQKYPGRDGNIYVDNPKIIRLSEVYLTASEAALKLEGSTSAKAVKYLNDLRVNRIKEYTPVASVTLDDVLEERRLELFCEGHNAWDYWRNKKSIKNSTVGLVDYTSNQTILPIPQREMISNSNLVQNPL